MCIEKARSQRSREKATPRPSNVRTCHHSIRLCYSSRRLSDYYHYHCDGSGGGIDVVDVT